MDKQTHIRQLTALANVRSHENKRNQPGIGQIDRKGYDRYNQNNVANNSTEFSCHLCKCNHNSFKECDKFQTVSNDERWNAAKIMGVCFMCMKKGHRRTECSEQCCTICNGPHNELLHNTRNGPQYPMNPGAPEYPYKSVSLSEQTSSRERKRCQPQRSFLPIVQVKLKNEDQHSTGRALLDSGSELNVISKSCFNRLQLKVKQLR